MNDKARKALGKRIRELREALGLSQIELAQRVDKSSAAYIAFIESGERNISTMDLMCLAKELGTTVAALVGEQKSSCGCHHNQNIKQYRVHQVIVTKNPRD
jgi:transcriptional regulator with XRE-family HTH domain